MGRACGWAGLSQALHLHARNATIWASRQGAVRRVATMQTTKRSGMSKATASTSGTYVATGPRRTTDRITAKQMRDFDARVDRAMEQAKQVSADLKRIGRK